MITLPVKVGLGVLEAGGTATIVVVSYVNTSSEIGKVKGQEGQSQDEAAQSEKRDSKSGESNSETDPKTH